MNEPRGRSIIGYLSILLFTIRLLYIICVYRRLSIYDGLLMEVLYNGIEIYFLFYVLHNILSVCLRCFNEKY